MAKLKIGIVGCGAIGSSLAKAIVKDFKDAAQLSALFDIDYEKSHKLSKIVSKKRNLSVAHLEQLINKSELVVEASSAASSWNIAKKTLSKSKDIMIMSVGGIARHFKELCNLARECRGKAYIPSGAIAGIDALKAANLGKLKSVTLTTFKNPLSFKAVEYVKSKGIMLDKIKKDTVLFSGSVKEAIRYFPQNINVAATLSIAAADEDLTQVKIIASPHTDRNIHEIKIDSGAARISTRTENIFHPENPKTSFLAVLSALATLRGILEPVKIGT